MPRRKKFTAEQIIGKLRAAEVRVGRHEERLAVVAEAAIGRGLAGEQRDQVGAVLGRRSRLLAPVVAPLACGYVPEPVRSRMRLPTRPWHEPAVRGFERTARAALSLMPGVLPGRQADACACRIHPAGPGE